MTITVFSLSTTGLPNFKLPATDPAQPRIVAMTATLYSSKWVEKGSFHGITKGEDSISSAEARAVHGVTERERELYGIEIKMMLAYFMRFVRHSKEIATFNMPFAKFVIDIELARGAWDTRDWLRGGMKRTCILDEAGSKHNAGRTMKIKAAHDAATGLSYDQPERDKHIYDCRAAARVLQALRPA
jgi:hypothetical protein